jgi:hypothetical protein
MYLQHHATYFTDLLRVRGYVFLRDVYEAFGIPITKASIYVGWYYDAEYESTLNFVDIIIDELDDGTFMLDFNVDGDISSKF